jgi:hypothetical protein
MRSLLEVLLLARSVPSPRSGGAGSSRGVSTPMGAASKPSRVTGRAPRAVDLGVLALVAVLGLGHLAYPFGGDQALFTIGAQDLSNGKLLYRDFWDFKQPGIFAFYYAAGRLFGFDEAGTHAFELTWMLMLSVVLMVTMKRWPQSSLVASLVPLLTVGHYYVVSESWHLTQVEGLAGLPMYLAMWYASAPQSPVRASRLYVSGVMGGLVLLFKFMFLPILLAFWLTAVVYTVPRRGSVLRGLASVVVPIVAGLLGPLVVTVAYFAWTDTLGLAYWTWFDFPRQVVKEIPVPSAWRLLGALEWFALRFSWLVALGLVGAFVALRQRADAMIVNLLWWCGLGGAIILVQAQSWWPYHFHLFFVPLGILAAIGIASLRTWIREADPFMATRWGTGVMLLAMVLLLSPAFGLMFRKAVPLAQEGFAWSQESRRRYQRAVSGEYTTVLSEVAFLQEPGSLPGRIYVFGSPLYHFLSNRGQATPLNGWFMEMAPAAQWQQVAAQLEEVRPPYIFVARIEGELIREHSPTLTALLHTAYLPLRESRAGLWYVRVAP